jgi:threonine dehydratase
MKKYAAAHAGENQCLVAIESGANVNFDRLQHIAERASLGEHKEALLAVTIPEKPGSFLRFCEVIGRRAVSEFNYRYADAGDAHIFVGIKLGNASERVALIERLQESGFAVSDLTESEMAKVHVRHMVGGRVPGLSDELLFRFQFPERPGALRDFLKSVGSRWNISLFHYRNHGAAFGRVLAGIQVPQAEHAACRAALDALQYQYTEETGHIAYELFLGTDAAVSH